MSALYVEVKDRQEETTEAAERKVEAQKRAAQVQSVAKTGAQDAGAPVCKVDNPEPQVQSEPGQRGGAVDLKI